MGSWSDCMDAVVWYSMCLMRAGFLCFVVKRLVTDKSRNYLFGGIFWRMVTGCDPQTGL